MSEQTSLIEKAVAMDPTIQHRAKPLTRSDSPRGSEATSGGTQAVSEKRTIVPPSLNKRSPYKQTASGRKYFLLDPRIEDIHFPDIAEALSKLCRYDGATRGIFYSVAQHCSLMCDIMPDSLKPYALLHDAHEAYTGDLTTPFKNALNYIIPHARKAVEEIQRRADAVIYPAAAIPYPIPDNITRAIKDADAAMLTAEKEQLLVPTDWNMPLANAAPVKITPKSWDNALDEYMFNLEKWVFPHMHMKSRPYPKPKG